MTNGITTDDILKHAGVKGMKWGVRKKESSSSNTSLKLHEESNKQIKLNSDGSSTVPKGFVFNRVGKMTTDVNDSGALYVSHGREDAARYVKALGPTMMGKLMKQYGEAVQHIETTGPIKVAPDKAVSKLSAEMLLKDDKMLKQFNDGLFASAVTGELGKKVSRNTLEKALNEPDSREAKLVGYGVGAALAHPNYTNMATKLYGDLRKQGFDAMPDTFDRNSGTSKTATIVINPEKLKITSATLITKDHMKAGKQAVKEYAKLKPSDFVHSDNGGETMDTIEDILQHAGVKGMKWGVRKADKTPKRSITVEATKDTAYKVNSFKGIVRSSKGTPLQLPLGVAYGVTSMVKQSKRKTAIAKGLGLSKKDFNSKDLKNAAKTVGELANVVIISGERSVKMSISTDDILQHAGVKGMKWGVIRSRSAKAAAKAGKVASSGAKKVANSRVGKEVGSVKREMQWNKTLKDVSKMSTSELTKTATRLQQENDLKRLSTNKEGLSLNANTRKANTDRRKVYLDRGKMSDAELSTAVTRMRVEDNLKRNVNTANAKTKAVGKKIVAVAAPLALKYALGEKLELKDIQAAFKKDSKENLGLNAQISAAMGQKVVGVMAKRAGVEI